MWVRLKAAGFAGRSSCALHPRARVWRKARQLAAVALAAMVALPAGAQQRSIINPGFEQPVVTSGGGFQQIANGLVPGWEADPDPTIEIWRNGNTIGPAPFITAFAGAQFAEMNSTRPGALYQLVFLNNGETLRWSFAHRARAGGAAVQIANYEIASATSSTTVIQTLASQSTPIGAGWLVNSNSVGVPFAGPSGTYRIQFRTTNPGSVGNFLDAIQIQLVPYIEFNATSTSDLEGAGSGGSLPRIVIDGNLATPLLLNLTVTGGTATLGTDYTTPSGTAAFTVTIPAGNYDSANFPTGIAVVNDTAGEADESIAISIGTSSNYQIASATSCGASPNTTLTHTIRDDDTPPAISVVKTGTFNDPNADGRPQPLETISYAFTVTNTGNVPLTGITLSDSLPGVSISGGPIASLGIGLSNTSTYTGIYSLTQADINAGGVTNTATVRGTGNNGFGGPDIVVTGSSSVTTPLTRVPALALVKRAPTGTPAVGNTLTYTVTATNTGNVTLTGVVVSDPLLSPISATCASVAPGATCVLTGSYLVTQANVNAGQIVNTAGVTGTPPAGPSVTGTSTVTTPITRAPGITLVKGAPTGTPAVGSTLSYTLTATNSGNVTLTGVVVGDPLLTPTSTTCTSVAPGGACVLTGTYVVTQANVDAGAVVNTGNVTGTPPGGPPVTGTSTITTPITRTPGIALVKAAPTGTRAVGNALSYSVTATNSGNVTLTGVVVSDPLLTPNSTTCTSVAPGRTCVLVGTYVVTQANVDAGQIINTAGVTATPPTGLAITGTSTVTTLITRTPGLTFVKDAPIGTSRWAGR